MISENSPFRSLPVGLNMRQRLILDAIRYAAEMAFLAHKRLRECLFGFSFCDIERAPTDLFVHAFSDAWSIVDCLHRLKPLLELLLGHESMTQVQDFLIGVNSIHLLRNNIQHLYARFDRLVSKKEAVWGSIGWISSSGTETTSFFINSLASGSMQGGVEYKITNPVGKQFSGPIGLITLFAQEQTIELDNLMALLSNMLSSIEEQLINQFRGLETSASDIYFRMPITFEPNPETKI